MLCRIAEAVLSGGIRRSAMISLFSADDREMLTSKTITTYDSHPFRKHANNSAVLVRNRITKKFYDSLWEIIQANGGHEPGFYFTNDKEWGTNPCAEIGLRDMQFCNLTTVNVADVDSQEELNARVEAAAFLGTLQATYTDFHFLRQGWKTTTEKDALLGVSMTGIANGKLDDLDLTEAVDVIKMVNTEWADKLGINSAARLTCVKPEGTASLVFGTSSGIHPWWSEYFIRTIRYNKEEPIAKYLMENIPDLVEDDRWEEGNIVVSVPQKAPEGAVTRSESAIDFLERVKYVTENWVKPGHIDGMNTHNVSATVNVRDTEWDLVREWMWVHRDSYNGLSLLPYTFDKEDGVEMQMPNAACDKETFEKYLPLLKKLDTSQIMEDDDNTKLQGELACSGGTCEIL